MSQIVDLIHKSLSGKIDDLIVIRRYLHQHPELSFEEYKTAEYIENVLKEAGINSRRIVKTGILATIAGKNPSKKEIVLRGDIDALPIQEATGLPFTSANEGVMHACGHDVHTTCVLGVALILNELKSVFEGTVHILFQPGEEKLPGGASLVLKEGVFDEYNISAFLGQHVFAELEAGKVGFRVGQYMASADEIYIDVNGPGGHAALPDRTVDVIYAAATLIQSLQQIISRNAPPEIPSVLTFGKIQGMGATNVIPKKVSLEGTFRSMNEDWRAEAHKRIVEIAEGISKSTGAKIDVDIRKGYPTLSNHAGVTNVVRASAEAVLGKENVVDLDIRMTSEDFAFYTQRYESCFYRLGIRSKGGNITNLHSPNFMVDESAIETGVAVMANAAISLLSQ